MATAENLAPLFDSPDYRAFLQNYILIKDIKLSDFARAAGCTRGFPSDVLNGRRRLTAKSYYSFEKALKVPLSYKKIFQLLVAKEEPDIFANIDSNTIDIKLQSLKQSQTLKGNRSLIEQSAQNEKGFEQILNNPHSMSVVAATGSPDIGATRQQIQQRTRLPDQLLEKTILLLMDQGLLRLDNNRYFSQDTHLYFQTKSTSMILSKLFNTATRSAEKRLSQITDNSDEMFFVSQFCIQENLMPQFKKEFRELVLKFVDDSIAENGSRVAKLITALHF